MDFGGTNFRAVRSELKGNKKVNLSQYKRSLLSAPNFPNLPRGLLDSKATATQLIDFFSATCKEFMQQEKDIPKNDQHSDSKKKYYDAGYTFSFPCTQRAINSAVLMEWTKGFETGSV